jgi:hypothetical protein
MAWEFAEGLIDEVMAYLEANLPAKLTAIDLAIADGIILTEPQEYSRRDPAISSRLSGTLPVLFVIVPQGKVTQWHATDADQEHILWIYLLARSTDPGEDLRKRMYRYGRAIFEVLIDHHFDTTTVHTWDPIGEVRFDYSPALTSGSISIADVKLELTYTKLETET